MTTTTRCGSGRSWSSLISVANPAARNKSCCKKHTEGQRNVYGMRFNTGDFMVAVQWYERLPESGERLEFFRGERVIDVINSTELRAVGVDVREIGLFPAEAGFNDPDALIKWELSRIDEAEALTWCR